MSKLQQHNSNIGVRRQQVPARNQLSQPQYLIAKPAASNAQPKTDTTEGKSHSSGTYHAKPSGSRLQKLKRERHLISSHSYDRKYLQDTERGLDLLRHPIFPSDEEDIILINPNHHLLPVVKTPQAKGAFDFYINSYVTSVIEISPQNQAAYANVIHQILHDELLFTAFTTVSEATRWRTQTLYDDAPASVVHGYGKTIQLLSKKLQLERFSMSPTILLTMGQLVAVETLIKNVSATARHLAGMQAAMKPKQPGTAPVRDAVDIWTMYFMKRAMIRPTIPKTQPLVYPKHPFDPKLGEKVADLPPGFLDIALSGRLSVEVLNLMARFSSYFEIINKLNKEGNMDMSARTDTILTAAAYMIEHHQITTLTVIERLIVTTLTAFVVRRDRIHPALINMRNYFQITCAYLVNLLSKYESGLPKEDHGSDLVLWAGLLLLLTSSPEAHARKLALKLLPRRPEPIKLVAKCEQFFWDEDLTNVLLSGQTLSTTASNDIIGDNIKQGLPDAERQTEVEDDGLE